MSDVPAFMKPEPPKKSRVWATIKALTRTRITAGLITVLPVYITIKVLQFVFRLLRDSSNWVVYGVLKRDWTIGDMHWGGFTDAELQNPALQWGLAIFSVFLTAFILYGIGVFTANIIGRRLIRLFETFVDRVPLAHTVYHAVKKILESFAGSTTTTFQRVALVPYPSRETRSIGFITSAPIDSASGDDLVSVFVPTTPNPTGGFVFVTRRSEVLELDWSVEDALKVIISCGILMPNQVHWPPSKLEPTQSKTQDTKSILA